MKIILSLYNHDYPFWCLILASLAMQGIQSKVPMLLIEPDMPIVILHPFVSGLFFGEARHHRHAQDG